MKNEHSSLRWNVILMKKFKYLMIMHNTIEFGVWIRNMRVEFWLKRNKIWKHMMHKMDLTYVNCISKFWDFVEKKSPFSSRVQNIYICWWWHLITYSGKTFMIILFGQISIYINISFHGLMIVVYCARVNIFLFEFPSSLHFIIMTQIIIIIIIIKKRGNYT